MMGEEERGLTHIHIIYQGLTVIEVDGETFTEIG